MTSASVTLSTFPVPLRPRYPSHVLFAFGGISEDGYMDTCITYDWAADTWSNIDIIFPHIWAYGMTVVNGDKIYLCGGIDSEGGATKQLWTFCPKSMEIRKLSSMKIGRECPSVCIFNNTIYSIGVDKRLDGTVTKSIQKYNISTNQWSIGPNMSKGRSCAGSAALGGWLYVLGGFVYNDEPVRTVEKYNPRTGKWMDVPPMKVARAGMGIVAMDGKLFVVGGWNGSESLRSGETFNPVTNEWSELPDMNIPRSEFSLVGFSDRLVAVGGISTGLEKTDQVEMLNSNTWVKLSSLPYKCFGLACSVLPVHGLQALIGPRREGSLGTTEEDQWWTSGETADSSDKGK